MVPIAVGHWRITRRAERTAADSRGCPPVFPAFIHNGDYYLANIVAYQDRVIDCWGLVTFEGFKEKIRNGWVVTSIPEGAPVHIHNVVSFTVSRVYVLGPEEEFVKDVADAI